MEIETIERVGIVYMYQCIIDKKVYIGQTLYPKARHRNHICAVGNPNVPQLGFYIAVREYGWEAFTYQVLEKNIPASMLHEKEAYYIKLYDASLPEHGYNVQGGDAWLASICQRNKTIIAQKKRISVTCVETGITYPSIMEASLQTGISRASISCAVTGTCHTASGYHWVYADGTKPYARRRTHLYTNTKRVVCMETGEVYLSTKEAGRITGISSTSIFSCCRGYKGYHTAGGFHWEYADEQYRLEAAERRAQNLTHPRKRHST